MTVSRECRNYRRDARRAYQLAGGRFLLRRQIQRDDPNHDKCSRCFDPDGFRPADPKCPICWGTGIDGGYHEAEKLWGFLSHNTQDNAQQGEHGDVDNYTWNLKMAYPPRVHKGDVVAHLVSLKPFILDTPMVINAVNLQTLVGLTSNDMRRLRRFEDVGEVSYESSIVGQNSQSIQFLKPNSPLYSQDFWKYNGETPEIVQTLDMPGVE